HRGAGEFERTLGADARTARASRAGIAAVARTAFTLRPGTGGGLQTAADSEDRDPSACRRNAVAAPGRPTYRRHCLRCRYRNPVATVRVGRLRRHRALH